MNVFSAIFFIILFFSLSFGAGERCGTRRFMEELRNNPQKKILAKEYRADIRLNEIKNTITTHFIIYYMTEGPHAVRTLAYIDSLAKYLEQAYDLHKNTLGMERISGASVTVFYEQSVPSGRYPVEVVDTGVGTGGRYCGTYGLTFHTNDRKPEETQIAIENDFIYGMNCPTARKGDPFTSSTHDYSKDWHLALKVTTFHELYHSFQSTQFDFSRYDTFWLEASAAGVEEIGAPEVNDYVEYVNYLPNPGKAMENLRSGEEYGYATLYLFLSSEFGKKFDSYIWKYFKNSPKETFAAQLARYVNSQGGESGDVEDLFHKYATHLFYSGKRAEFSPYDKPFSDDMQEWRTWTIKTNDAPLPFPVGTFDFFRTYNDAASKTDSVTKVSKLLFGKDNDSTVWVLSKLSPPVIPPLKEFAAYPNPWRPKRSEKVKFGPLPNSGGVEIRSANGALLKRIEGKTGDTLTWQPEKLPAPGILYYRTLPYGKNKMLILEH
ncbi:MAG: hypothetical protein LBC64_06120 [Fibromonadaceae bacterium]|jgi:hypothetical protein|nr:hypothetical protein [Fibromonadaceae bacterium]